jgi:hypothetical protein
LGVGISFAFSVHHRLITIDQFDAFLTSASIFITSTCGSLYGMNKLADYAKTKVTIDTAPIPPIASIATIATIPAIPDLPPVPVTIAVTNASSQPPPL